MFKSAAIAAVAVLGAAGFASSASAAVITPNPTAFTLTGSLVLVQSTTVTCNVTLTGTVAAGGGSATITGATFAPGSWQCGTLVGPSGLPWTITPGAGPTITVTGISATSILGRCAGTISAAWNNATSSVTFSGATIPGTPRACSLTGTLRSNVPLQIN